MSTAYAKFYMPTKPCTLVDAINRMAAATGSMSYAMASAGADYNGHALSLSWNDYRGYYVCEYHWGERVVLVRDADFGRAIAGAKSEFARQGRGASLRISVREQDVEIAKRDADLIAGEEGPEPWRTWQFAEVGMAVKFGWTHHLIAVTSPENYKHLIYNHS